ncbi:energy transducer TonB [Desulfuromonas sp. AOP6]|uniref:energy transducer TonB n=1 Tax=Desulfuromonas sp. AOP6 TaxID=1566351 RepID=UPI001275F1F2|nr:energy transducer TonB [Desulfuromonas sp. AOP6]BCA79045.1 protein TonB [Desulfuromonas sp. AOP6]
MRFVGALCGGVVVTLSLFWMMQAMTAADTHLAEDSGRIRMIEFTRYDRESQTNVRRRVLPEKPKLPQQVTAPKMVSTATVSPPKIPQVAMAAPSVEVPVSLVGAPSLAGVLSGVPTGMGLGVSGGEADLIPLVRITPLYPRMAQMRGLEGEVRVEFTITETGMVMNPTVIDSNPPGVFEQAALAAIMRWKFKPRMENGQAVSRLATQIITFNLNE